MLHITAAFLTVLCALNKSAVKAQSLAAPKQPALLNQSVPNMHYQSHRTPPICGRFGVDVVVLISVVLMSGNLQAIDPLPLQCMKSIIYPALLWFYLKLPCRIKTAGLFGLVTLLPLCRPYR